MGRKVVFSAMMLAGLAQMSPASAQIEDRQDDWGRSPAAGAHVDVPPVEAAGPMETGREEGPAAPERVADARPAPAPSPDVEEGSVPAEPAIAKINAREPDLADRDLAAVPPEEARPVLIDPTAARRAAANVVRRTPSRQDDAHPAHEPVLAAAAPPSEPVRTEQDRDPMRAPVERVAAAPPPALPDYRDARPNRGGQYRAPAPTVAERATRAEPDEREQYRRAANDAMEHAVRSDDPAGMADTLPARADRAPAYPPVYAGRDTTAPSPPIRTPDYAGDDRGARAGYPEDYPNDVRARARDYDGREYDDGGRSADEEYALADRDYREPGLRGASYGRDPVVARICDGDRVERLQRRLRRDIDERRINWRTASDLEAEIGHAEDLRRSYCSSGLNAWREERLDRQYAQLEDRLRYEESRGGWR